MAPEACTLWSLRAVIGSTNGVWTTTRGTITVSRAGNCRLAAVREVRTSLAQARLTCTCWSESAGLESCLALWRQWRSVLDPAYRTCQRSALYFQSTGLESLVNSCSRQHLPLMIPSGFERHASRLCFQVNSTTSDTLGQLPPLQKPVNHICNLYFTA